MIDYQIFFHFLAATRFLLIVFSQHEHHDHTTTTTTTSVACKSLFRLFRIPPVGDLAYCDFIKPLITLLLLLPPFGGCAAGKRQNAGFKVYIVWLKLDYHPSRVCVWWIEWMRVLSEFIHSTPILARPQIRACVYPWRGVCVHTIYAICSSIGNLFMTTNVCRLK